MILMLISKLSNLSPLLWFLLVFGLLPTAAALSEFSSFPELTFKTFSQFIEKTFQLKYHCQQYLLYCLQ